MESFVKNEDNIRESTFDINKYPCMINKIHLSINANGEVYPCETIADDTDANNGRNMKVKYVDSKFIEFIEPEYINLSNIGNLNEESLIDIWKNNYKLSFESDKCKNCYSRYQPIIEAYYGNCGKKIFI
jgi:MoaA/NifB/PqqE/SkfB family radical SAM enzyme